MKRSLEERFWAKVVKGDGCWEWSGAHVPEGYGSISNGTRQVGAHRVSWQIHNGPIPTGLFVCHRCNNKGCVRPDHLYVGTSRENTLDASRSGLLPRGAGYWNTKLTPAQVNQIRELTDAGLPTVEIAQRFGISHDAVRNIRIGRSWSWLKRAA